MTTVHSCHPRRATWQIATVVAGIAFVAAYALTGSWRGLSIGGVSVAALLACALPCTIPLLVARLITRWRNPDRTKT